MNCRHFRIEDFGIEDKSSTGLFELSVYMRGEGGCERLRVSAIYDLRSLLLQNNTCFWLYNVKPSRDFC